MKKRTIFFYSLLLIFLAFFLIKANYTNEELTSFLPNNVNTTMNVSVGSARKAPVNRKHRDDKISQDKELLDTYEITTEQGNVIKKIYKFSHFDKLGLVDENGKKIVKALYDDITEFDKSKGFYKTKLNDLVGLISIKSGVLIPAKFQDIELTQNDDIVFIKNYKYSGLYDTKNRVLLLKPIYSNLIGLNKYNWKLYSAHKVGLLYSKNGNTVLVKPKYSEIEPYKNMFKSYIGDKVGLISYQNGEILAEPIYNDIELLNSENDNVQVFRTSVDDRYGVIFYSKSGELTVVSPIYQDVQYKGRVNVLSGGYWRILDNKGNVTSR